MKRPRSADHHCAVPPARLAIRLEPVATAQRHEQLPLPRIGERVEEDHLRFASTKLDETSANALRGALRRLALAVDLRSGMERFDLPQLLQ